jgi:hypothetical protein
MEPFKVVTGKVVAALEVEARQKLPSNARLEIERRNTAN